MTHYLKNYLFIVFFAFLSCNQTNKSNNLNNEEIGTLQETKFHSKNIETNIKKEYNYISLPFDFEEYYMLCYDDEKKCKQKYPSYQSPESDSILSDFAIKENPTYVFMLPPVNEFQPIVIAFTDSDIEGYYLFITKKGQVISSKEIGKMDGDSIKDFNISKDYIITLYNRKNSDDIRKENKKYKISKDGKID